ncbi:MAG: hypothetical protein R3236_01110, partial [Phycisphaeraceae bacterium]|nr:hypothetical protein [Phycisphaeraceae bacterium]
MKPTDLTDLDKQLLGYLDDSLADADSARIEKRLLEDPAAADRLMLLAQEEATLRSWAKAYAQSRQIDEAEADLGGPLAKRSVGLSGRFRWAAVLIGVLGAGLIVLVLMLRSGPKHLPGTIVEVAAL